MIKVEGADGKILLFITNNIPESEVIFSGLKLLVEKETSRLGIRGGKKVLEEEKDVMSLVEQAPEQNDVNQSAQADRTENDGVEDHEGNYVNNEVSTNLFNNGQVEAPIYNQPTRTFEEQSFTMNASHASNSHGSVSSYDNSGEFDDSSSRERSQMRYVQGQVIHTQIVTNVSVPLPLPFCRALLLDSTSPLIEHWAINRGDFNFSYGDWISKDALSPRSVNHPNLQQCELIAKCNMAGSSRTSGFERIRKGRRISLSETWVVDIDDSDMFVFNIVERMPRRGFSLKIRIAVRPSSLKSSDVTVVGEVIPLGRNTSDQAVVHRAFILVVKELHSRYGLGDAGK